MGRETGTLRVKIVFASRRLGMARFSRRLRRERLFGSDLLRLQLKELVTPHLPSNIRLSFSTFSQSGRSQLWNFDNWLRFQRPSVVILLKNVAYQMKPEQIERLKAKSIAVGVDHKDGDLAKFDLSPFDFHISSSRRGQDALNDILRTHPFAPRHAFAGLLFQGHDTRLDALSFPGVDRFAPVYVGLPANAEIPKRIMDGIDVFEVACSKDMDDASIKLPSYNFHFGVRPNPPTDLLRSYKPFTKGVTAAACRSNILVNRQVDDAIELLTEDYPYLVASNGDADVEDGFRKAREEFGGPEWNRGLEMMQAMRARVSGKALADQLFEIVTRAADAALTPVLPGAGTGARLAMTAREGKK